MKTLTPSRSRNRSGFTLIELLVVISIIALLVGILLPALGRARKAANMAVDMSNQRQIMIGVHSYAADANGYMPLGSAMDGANFPSLFNRDNNPATTGRDEPYSPGVAYFSIWGSWGSVNGAHGLGVLIPRGEDAEIDPVVDQRMFGNYLTIDVLFSPFDQKAESYEQSHDTATYPSMWTRRGYFGQELDLAWSADGQPWQHYNGGANSDMLCSYNWRGTDYTWIDDVADARDTTHYDPAGSGNGSLVGGVIPTDAVVAGFQYGLTERSEVAAEPMLMNRFPWSMHGNENAGYLYQLNGTPLPTQTGSNVMLGDGSGSFVDDEDWVLATIGPIGRGDHQGWVGGRYPGSRFFAELKYHVLD